MDLIEAYKTLELPVGASKEEVREAYRDLLKVWHPDRHVSDPPLQKRAEERLKRIVAAFEFIEQSGFPPPPSTEPREQPYEQSRTEQTAPPEPRWEANERREAPVAPPCPSPATTTSSGSSNTAVRVVVAILVSVAVVGIWGYYNEQSKPSHSYESSSSYSPPASYERRSYDPSPTDHPSEGVAPTVQETKPVDRGPPPFTLGSTRAEVEAAQGTPTSIDKTYGETWWYQAAQVKFADGRVFSWSASPYSKLNVALVPKDRAKAEAAIARGSYTLGSSKDEVLAIQGTPDQLDRTYGETWWYGASTIRFSDGKVYAWDSGIAGTQLKVELRPRSTAGVEAAAARGFYGPHATKDEVLAIEGTPRGIDKTYGETWWYGASTLKFSDGRVTEYDSSPTHPLKLRLKDSDPDRTVDPSKATLPGFMDTVVKMMDKAGDDICACDSLACAKQIASTARNRGFEAGFAYTKDKVPTAELSNFFSTMTTDNGAEFGNYLKEHYGAWYSRLVARIDGCIGRLQNNGSVNP